MSARNLPIQAPPYGVERAVKRLGNNLLSECTRFHPGHNEAEATVAAMEERIGRSSV